MVYEDFHIHIFIDQPLRDNMTIRVPGHRCNSGFNGLRFLYQRDISENIPFLDLYESDYFECGDKEVLSYVYKFRADQRREIALFCCEPDFKSRILEVKINNLRKGDISIKGKAREQENFPSSFLRDMTEPDALKCAIAKLGCEGSDLTNGCRSKKCYLCNTLCNHTLFNKVIEVLSRLEGLSGDEQRAIIYTISYLNQCSSPGRWLTKHSEYDRFTPDEFKASTNSKHSKVLKKILSRFYNQGIKENEFYYGTAGENLNDKDIIHFLLFSWEECDKKSKMIESELLRDCSLCDYAKICLNPLREEGFAVAKRVRQMAEEYNNGRSYGFYDNSPIVIDSY